ARLTGLGYTFTSETDTEVIAHLVRHHLKSKADLLEAVRATCGELVGAYAIAIVSEGEDSRIVVARHGSPLVLGQSDSGNYAA
ncbi:UNVERIFIED_CONTAM: glutamine--fructose-6-phosphate aminotransferase, partial [Salmonella enterica subsp. enterica serovar Weltevreden]